MVVQPDGKIIVVGMANGGFLPSDDWAVARYNPDGSLDTTFGQGGFFRYEMLDDRPRGCTTWPSSRTARSW